MHKIKIDFYGSTHGHFLEYVANVYIMQTAPSLCSIFKPPTYSAHAADQNYHKNKIITCGHYSNPIYKLTIDSKDTVIRILIDNKDDNLFFVALTNLMHKAGDIGVEKQMLSIPESIRNSPVDIRNNWYSKFAERNLYADYYTNFTPIDCPVFDFNFCSFFSFEKFCIELNRLAEFLDQTFFPNKSLYNLWLEFIKYNQGWQSYVKCNQILENIFANNSIPIDCTAMEQGWLNYKLANICRIYQGSMFENKTYPANTQLIYQEINSHLDKLK
jgi:hypothetical protein